MKTYYAEYEAERRLPNDGHRRIRAADDSEALKKAREQCPRDAVLMHLYTEEDDGEFREVTDGHYKAVFKVE